MERDLENRVAVVTGGSRGLGRAIALELARRGAFVTVNYNRNGKEAENTLAAIQADGGNGKAYQTDISKPDQVQAMFKEIFRDHKKVDILVNNAGITRDDYFLTMRPQGWSEVIDTNLHAVFNTCKAVIRNMCAARRGVIINVTSGAALGACPGQVNYSAAKAALLGFSRSLAREVADKGVRVVNVAPGFFKTDMTQALDERIVEETTRVTPLGRWGFPEELASAIAFLACDDAAYVTGQTIIVDGGRGAVESDFGF
jgi:3-oxoacyl-[acyl-carrier protein] reductase